jgi:hypothetical protein
MSENDAELHPIGTFDGGFSYHFRWAQPASRMARLEVFADRIVLRPRSGRRSIFTPTWEARYDELQVIRAVRWPRGIRFRRADSDTITFRPAGEFLQGGMEPVLTALRLAGAEIE